MDNLPPRLLPALIDFCREEGHERGAVVIDIRSGTAFDRHVLALQEIVAGTPGRWPQPAGHPGSRSTASHGEPAPDVSP